MRKILCAGGFPFMALSVFAQPSFPLSAGSLGRNSLSVISFTEQPASLLCWRSATVGISGEKNFLLTGYGQYCIAVALPEKKNNFGFSAFYGGSVFLHKSSFGLTYARRLGEKLGLALQFNYTSIGLPASYGKASAVFSRLGVTFQLTPQLKTAFNISDPLGTTIKKGEIIHRPDYSMALGYEPSAKFFAAIHFYKQELSEPNVVVDLAYSPFPCFRIHGGINADNGSSWAGICWIRKQFRFGLILSSHQQLGISPISHLQFQAGKTQGQ